MLERILRKRRLLANEPFKSIVSSSSAANEPASSHSSFPSITRTLNNSVLFAHVRVLTGHPAFSTTSLTFKKTTRSTRRLALTGYNTSSSSRKVIGDLGLDATGGGSGFEAGGLAEKATSS